MILENQALNRTEQQVRCIYAKMYIKHSRYYQLYGRQQHKQIIIENPIVNLSHNKRKKPNEKLVCMKFLKDSKTVVLGYDKQSQRGDINFIDVAEPKINDFYYNKLQGGLGGLSCFEDGRFIVVADKKGVFTFLDMFKGPNIEDIKDKNIQTTLEGVLSISLAPSQKKLVCGMNDKKCVVIDINKQRLEKKFPICRTFNYHTYGVNSVHWHPYRSLIVSSSLDLNDTLKLWDAHSQESISQSNFHKNSIIKCMFHPNGDTYFSLGKDNCIIQYDIRYKGILHRFNLQAQPTTMDILRNQHIITGDSAGYLTQFTPEASILHQNKGASSISLVTVDDSSNLLVVGRDRQHLFEIYAHPSITQIQY